jgi:hypothetical protein
MNHSGLPLKVSSLALTYPLASPDNFPVTVLVKQNGPMDFCIPNATPHSYAVSSLLFASEEPVWIIFQPVSEVLFVNFSIHANICLILNQYTM